MQEDMHYYGTYAMARAAGMEVRNAQIVATAAQYVDDALVSDDDEHDDGGMFQIIATSHNNSECIVDAALHHLEQRSIWVPFHFFPGNEGETLSERLGCVKDSKLSQEMVENHLRHAVLVKDEYGLALMGVMAHVYADTFSHYGFSGVSSRNNAVKGGSFEFNVKNESVKNYITDKYDKFIAKYTPSFVIKNWRKVLSQVAEEAVGSLGHGGVGTYPDRPFLNWRFSYEKDHRDSGWRNNPGDYLEGCEKLHAAFSEYARNTGIAGGQVSFDSIREKVSRIVGLEAAMDKRIAAWKKAIGGSELFAAEKNEALDYSPNDWEQQKQQFKNLPDSNQIAKKEIYQFHQAAIYHRDYTLKHLLPKYGIVVV